MENIYNIETIQYYFCLLIKMGFWGKVKGVFGRIGRGVKDYVVKPVLKVAETAGAPLGAAIATAAGVDPITGMKIGGAIQQASGILNRFIK